MENKLFSPSLLQTSIDSTLDGNLVIRPLSMDDFDHGFLPLLGQLTDVGEVTKDVFEDQFSKMKNAQTYYVIVIEDSNTGKLVASTTLFLEYKFIHSCSMRGRIEDVVVDDAYRGKGLGKRIVESAVELSRKLGCYKISLDCRDEMIPFYENLGFVGEKGRANMLVIRF